MKPYALQLDLQLFSQEKTERATPKKRQEAREKGQVAKSMELPAALILFFTFLFFFLYGGSMKTKLTDLMNDTLNNRLLMEMTMENLQAYFTTLLYDSFLILAPILLLTLVFALVANYAQVGILFTTKPLMVELNKLNPIEGFKRIFSMRSAIEFVKSILKTFIIGIVVFLTFWNEKEKLLTIGHMPVEQSLSYVSHITLMLGIKIGAILIALAVFDYMYQKYEYEKSLRMSKQDIKDEYKKSEGDPLIKSKIKEKQRRMALMRMMQEIPKADVIITNPTHFAVAIKYESGKMDAPTVIAKGTDYVAQKIKEKAREHGIVTMENKPLARALYAQVDIGSSIPADLFQAVAEVLAYVYKAKGKGASRERRA
ncbi:flagellar biosynthesis protein FlhB [Paenibacillus sp. N1-5-1-14]|uniref:flagellar biosynthesis protein FlhB n=1 Tax=Paenibacillus radicibacter TaxID=2972488 RepID=UPI002159B49A|nr:flagellar biosynthesis protein FlhB [Paenibacillus radicibacter]MCR8642176.1 flagellar biosynthesis protein FlhB [Paenibacillus radicibacter]